MARSTLARVGLVAALAIVYVTGVTIGSEKSASAMATAAELGRRMRRYLELDAELIDLTARNLDEEGGQD